ncbi:F-box protein At3g07870-like isoform X10 [Quercus robur]|uniref:F-box protein At3g07870-like isoform X10 n=1 Tax=Quercus robur TaxID=38942 RepID=UPI0021639DC5|nr:F-box protein At3g07870-like isoform X10 [Quercus robur]
MGRKSKSHSDPTTSMAKKKAKAEKADEKVGGTDIISQLHPNIVIDILSRLPFNTLFSCRCVCKTWLHLLVDPSFAQLYHTRADPCIILQPTNKNRQQHLYAVHFDNTNYVLNSIVKFATETHLGMGCNVKLSLLDSCNGLILLGEMYRYQVKLDQLYVCNPITGEFVIVRPGINLTSSAMCPCLGFCPKSQVYKVVLLSKKKLVAEVNNNMVTLVYTLGEKGNGLWKSVNVGDGLLDQPKNTTFLNGIIHWVVRSHTVPQFIYSFDVEDECFRLVPPPPEFVSPDRTTWSKWGINLGVLEGRLAIVERAKGDFWCFHIWVMKDYGVQASWTKTYTMDFMMGKVKLKHYSSISQILGLCRNGDILFTHHRRNLVSFNPVNPSFKIHKIDKLCNFLMHPYIPNLSSLRDIARGEPLFNATLR